MMMLIVLGLLLFLVAVFMPVPRGAAASFYVVILAVVLGGAGIFCVMHGISSVKKAVMVDVKTDIDNKELPK
jgi:hypothetical protein